MFISNFSALYCLPEIDRNLSYPFSLNCVSPYHPFQKTSGSIKGEEFTPGHPQSQGQGQDTMAGVSGASTPYLCLPELKTTSIDFTGKETGDRSGGAQDRLQNEL